MIKLSIYQKIFALSLCGLTLLLIGCKEPAIPEHLDFDLSIHSGFALESDILLDDMDVIITYSDGTTGTIQLRHQNIEILEGIHQQEIDGSTRFHLDTSKLGVSRLRFTYEGLLFSKEFHVYDPNPNQDNPDPDETLSPPTLP